MSSKYFDETDDTFEVIDSHTVRLSKRAVQEQRARLAVIKAKDDANARRFLIQVMGSKRVIRLSDIKRAALARGVSMVRVRRAKAQLGIVTNAGDPVWMWPKGRRGPRGQRV